MQEEMRKNTLESLVENEKKGTIYAKITQLSHRQSRYKCLIIQV